MLNILSLGAGVQSTTMALMAAHGEITPMPDCAIFADTGWEPKAVYDHLEWLCERLPFPVHRVTAGNIRTDTLRMASGDPQTGRLAAAPFYTSTQNGEAAPLRRQCTSHYKIEPIQQLIRSLLGLKPRQRTKDEMASVWIGISGDEAMRMRDSQVPYILHRFPLLERAIVRPRVGNGLWMTRQDCLKWLGRHEYPRPPKSSCIGCPYHSNEHWRRMRDEAPAEWADAVYVDKAIRGGFAKTRNELFLHRSLKPLDEVVLSSEDVGQLGLPLSSGDCEGMCGV